MELKETEDSGLEKKPLDQLIRVVMLAEKAVLLDWFTPEGKDWSEETKDNWDELREALDAVYRS